MLKLIRSNVYVIPNSFGGIYEITDDPDVMKVTVEQVSAWWQDGHQLTMEIRRVELFTDISLYKKGTILPGNILVAYTTEPITDNLDEFLHYDNYGQVFTTPEDHPIYTYYYYSAKSKFKHTGPLEEDDILEHLTTPSSI